MQVTLKLLLLIRAQRSTVLRTLGIAAKQTHIKNAAAQDARTPLPVEEEDDLNITHKDKNRERGGGGGARVR
jgi:hypothetical protein